MHRIGFLICLFLVTGSLQAQKKDTVRRYLDQHLSLTNRNKAYYYGVSFPMDDHWMLYATYPDGSVLMKAWFKDEKLKTKDGPFQYHYGKGVKSVQGYYVNNQQYGCWKYWYPNGVLKDSGILEYNQMVGEWKSWHENGQLTTIGHYKFDSSLHLPKPSPVWRSLFPSTEDIYSLKNGNWMSFDTTGKILDSGEFINNTRNGVWKFWYPSGELEVEGEYQNDSMVNQWNWYRENGKPSTKEVYRSNKLVKVECFDDAGNYTGDYCSILRPPYPLGNFHDFQSYMMETIQMPASLRNRPLEGTVTIKCVITRDGKLNKVSVDGPYKELNEEVEKFFNSLTAWAPAVIHNRTVEYTVEYKIPLSYRGDAAN